MVFHLEFGFDFCFHFIFHLDLGFRFSFQLSISDSAPFVFPPRWNGEWKAKWKMSFGMENKMENLEGCKMEQNWKTQSVFNFPISHPSKFSAWFPFCFPSRKLCHFVFHFLSTPKDLYFLLKFLRICPFRLPLRLRAGKTEWKNWKAT